MFVIRLSLIYFVQKRNAVHFKTIKTKGIFSCLLQNNGSHLYTTCAQKCDVEFIHTLSNTQISLGLPTVLYYQTSQYL